MKNLDSLLEMYNALQEQEMSIKNFKETLKQEIIEELNSRGRTSYISTNGLFKGSIASKTSVKYNDEIAIINYLQDNNLTYYLKTTIDTTSFNKLLKGSETLQESLSGKFAISEIPALTVKKVLNG